MRCFHATQLILTAVLVLLTGRAEAQNVPGSDAAQLPEPASVARAFLVLEQWVRSFELPAVEDEESERFIEGGQAACVILRRSGRVIGTGIDTEADARMLRRAAGRAMSQVLGDDAVRSIAPEALPDLGEAMTIELEIAGAMQPLPGRSLAQIIEQLEPGVHGLAVRGRDGWSVLFPTEMRLTNVANRLAARVPGMAAEVGTTITDVNNLPSRAVFSMYRFRTVHLVQTSANRTPVQLIGGEDEVSLSSATLDGVTRLADGVAEHLLRAMWPSEPPDGLLGDYDKPIGVMGDYQPHIDTVRQPTAPLLDQAMTAFALLRYARTPGVDPELAADARAAGAQIVNELHERAVAQPTELSDPSLAAAVVYALCEWSVDLRAPRVQQWLGDLTASLAMLYEDNGQELQQTRRRLPPHARAMVAGGLARALREDGELLQAGTVRLALDEAWQSVSTAFAPGLLPWIGWGELDYALATGETVAHADSLRQMRDALTVARVGSGLMRGGYALHPDHPGHATAQTTRPVCFLATMVREPSLTPHSERPVALARVLGTLRFVMQLAVRDPMRWSYLNPDRAVGGVRTSLTDSTQPIAAQAMGLLAACEAILSMQAEPAQRP